MENNSSEKQWDVFLSYARQDFEFVEVLAENLHRGGLEVFWDEWEIGPGDRLVHKLEEGLLYSKNGVLVVSPAALSRPWVLEEYDAMVRMAVENGKSLIPALFIDAELPPFLANRVWVDFREAYGPRFEKNVKKLVRALKGEEPERPERLPDRDGKILPRPDEVFRPEGPMVRTLRIARDKVVFSGGYKTVSHKPRGFRHEDEGRLYELERARRGAVPENSPVHRPVSGRDGAVHDPDCFTVHRWTAFALAARMDEKTRKDAHRAAAGYWNWRAGLTKKSVDPHLEARYHCFQCGDMKKAVALSETICSRLHTWGAWRQEERLCRETIGWLPERSFKKAAFLHQLGIISQNRGDYGQALAWYRKSLEIFEELGNRAGMASSLSQIGILHTDTGKPEAGVTCNLKSLSIRLELEVPQVAVDLRQLRRQKKALGDERFRKIAAGEAGEELAGKILELMEKAGKEEG